MGTAIILVVIALWTDVLQWLAEVTESESIVSILYFGAFVFLMLVALQFSVRITKLSFRSNTMTQKIALLENEIEQLKQQLAEREATRTEIEEPTEAP